MGLLRRLAHKTGLWTDTELSKWELAEKFAEKGTERWSTRGKTAEDRLAYFERRAAVEFGAVRPAAERELAQRQERAQNARAQLAQRGVWITDPPAVTDPVERQRLGAWQAFHLGEMRKAEEERAAPRQVKKQAQALRSEQAAPHAAVQRVQARQDERQRVVRKTAAENAEEAAHSYWGGLVAKSKRRKQEQEQDQPLSHRQKHRQGYGQGL
jgi:hypothetical protein